MFVCPHRKSGWLRVPQARDQLVEDYVRERNVDLAASAMVGDRDTDLEFARNLGMRGLHVRRMARKRKPGPRSCATLTARRATRQPQDEGNGDPTSPSISTPPSPIAHRHRHRLLRSHARADRQARRLLAGARVQGRPAHRRASHGRGLRARARRSAAQGARRQARHRALRFPAADGRSPGARRHRSLRPRVRRVRRQVRARTVGGLPTELVPHFFRSLAETLGAAIHVSVTGENTHHMVEACFKGVGRALRRLSAAKATSCRRRKACCERISMTAVVIIDSGGANLASLQFALERLGAEPLVTADADTIRERHARHPAGRRLRAGRHGTAANVGSRPG